MFFCASFCIQLYPFSCKTTKDLLFKCKRSGPLSVWPDQTSSSCYFPSPGWSFSCGFSAAPQRFLSQFSPRSTIQSKLFCFSSECISLIFNNKIQCSRYVLILTNFLSSLNKIFKEKCNSINCERFPNVGILTSLRRKWCPRPSVECWRLPSTCTSSHQSSSSCCPSCRWSSCTPWWAGSWWRPPGGDNLWWRRGTVYGQTGATRQRRQSWRCWVRQKFPISN